MSLGPELMAANVGILRGMSHARKALIQCAPRSGPPARIDFSVATTVQHVVLRDESRRLVIQPVSKIPIPHEVANAMGGRISYEEVMALFPMDELRESVDHKAIVSSLLPSSAPER